MARPNKIGLEYFSLDCQLDDEVELIVGKYKSIGFHVLIKLYQKIYGGEGYFIKWDEKSQLLISNRVFTDINTVTSIVSDCIKWGIFDEKMYNKYNILTSKRIQKQYINSTYKRAEVDIIQNYLLINKRDRDNIRYLQLNDNGNADTTRVPDNGNADTTRVSDVNPPSNKESNKESNKKSNKYRKLYDYYCQKENLINHRKYNPDYREAIKRAEKRYNLDFEDCKKIIDRHNKLVEISKNNDIEALKNLKTRPLDELFGQGKFKSKGLICKDYLDDGDYYRRYLKTQIYTLDDLANMGVNPSQIEKYFDITGQNKYKPNENGDKLIKELKK